MGAALRVPFARAAADDWPGVLARVRAAGFTHRRADAARAVGDADDVRRPAEAARLALIVGTEGAGLTPAVEAAADYRVRIPISGDVDSLNLAVATGIALHALGSR